MKSKETNRRKFLQVLAGSPLLQYMAVPGLLLGKVPVVVQHLHMKVGCRRKGDGLQHFYPNR